MRLYERMYEPFTRLAKSEALDGQGGVSARWTDSDRVMCCARLSSTGEGRSAGKGAPSASFDVISDAPVIYGDVLRRDSDGSVVRCVSSGADGAAPKAASFGFWTWRGERWEVPDADQA